MSASRVLIVTGAAIGARMAGPAIRASTMAEVLCADGHQVVLATTATLNDDAVAVPYTRVALRPRDRRSFKRLHDAADVIVFQGHAMEQFPLLAKSDRVVVADAYDPMHLEMLEHGRGGPRATWELLVLSRSALLNQQLLRADVVLCASQRQRSLYLGQLASLGRVSPATYEDDPHLSRLLAIAPFGLDAVPPASRRAAMRGVFDGLDQDSRILLWGGGIYSWFDPIVLIEAVHALAQRRPETKLFFLGTRPPGSEAVGIVKEAIETAERLGAIGTSVVFNEEWVPYEERGAFLLEANVGVSTHLAHVETEYSFRTRILDYLWAGLPMVVTAGDTFADLVKDEELGVVVPAEDVAALEAALEKVLYDEDFAAQASANVRRTRERFVWEQTLEPLRAIARDPRRASDVELAGGRAKLARSLKRALAEPQRPGIRRDLRKAWHYLWNGGPKEVSRRYKARNSGR